MPLQQHTVFYTADLSDYTNSLNIATCALIRQYCSTVNEGKVTGIFSNIRNLTPNDKVQYPKTLEYSAPLLSEHQMLHITDILLRVA
jgi:hypothetical protein